jgi:signal transduction histidine kinase
VRGGLDFDLTPGSRLKARSTLCHHVCSTRSAMVVESASRDPRWLNHPALLRQRFDSYIAVPIVLGAGAPFGTLVAMDSKPRRLSESSILSMFQDFAKLIAAELAGQAREDETRAAHLDERAVGELREQFIAILGHDLRNPLHALAANCDILGRRHSDEWTRAVVARMQTNTRRMSELVDHVLDFARARMGGGIGIHLQASAGIDDALNAIVREVQDARPERSIVAEIRVQRTIACDVGRLQQLASNLLGNAVTHGAPNTPVRLRAGVRNDELILDVWNDGEPIPADSLDKIFSPFWRRQASVRRGGLGLGLYICAEIVRAHGGRLTVASTLSEGTLFTARIPCGALPADGAGTAGGGPAVEGPAVG